MRAQSRPAGNASSAMVSKSAAVQVVLDADELEAGAFDGRT